MVSSGKSVTTYLVGRSLEADIRLGDTTVSRLHAELVQGADGTWYLTDRRSTGGTWVLDQGDWIPLAQDFVRPGDRIRFGSYESTLDELLRLIPSGVGRGGQPGAASEGPTGDATIDDELPKGRVGRDPKTGDIYSLEDE